MEIRRTAGAKSAECVVYLISLVILSAILGSRQRQLKELLLSRQQWGWQRLCQIELLACFIFSWTFVALSTFVQYGTKAKSHVHSNVAIIAILVLLVLSRLSSLLFMLECVFVSRNNMERKSTKPWVAGSFLIFLGVPVTSILLVGRKVNCEAPDECEVGFTNWSSIPALIWYISCSIYLSIAFVIPLFRSQFKNSPLRKHAYRTIVCTTVAATWTICSTISLIVLRTAPAWLLLAMCSCDLTVSSICFSIIVGGNRSGSHSSEARTSKCSPNRQSLQWNTPTLGYHLKASPVPGQQQDTTEKMDERSSWRPIFNRRRASEGATPSPVLQMDCFPTVSYEAGRFTSFDTHINSILSPVEEREDTLSASEEGLGIRHPKSRV